jgi:hypothetical protein
VCGFGARKEREKYQADCKHLVFESVHDGLTVGVVDLRRPNLNKLADDVLEKTVIRCVAANSAPG